MKTLKQLFMAGAAMAIAFAFSSCSTTEGFGKDLQRLGSEIEEEAEEHAYD